MLTATIPFTRVQFAFVRKFALTPYEWQDEARIPNVVPKSSTRKWHWRIYTAHLVTHAVYATGTLANYVLTWRDMEVGQRMMAMMFLVSSNCNFLMRFTFVVEEQGLVDMNRLLLQFEGRNPQVRRERNDLVTKSIQLMGILAGIAAPILIGTILVVKPCTPPFLGYVLMSSGGMCSARNWHWLARICLALPDVFIWYTAVAPGSYYVFSTCFVEMRCLAHNLERVAAMLIPSPSRGFRTRWRGHHPGFTQYSQLQIIAKRFNEVYQGLMIPSLMFASAMVLCSSLYACVKLHESIPMPGFIAFPVMMVLSLNAIFIVKQGASVLKQSKRCLEVAKNNSTRGRRSIHKKMARAMGRVMVRFGSTNFVEDLTPFNLIYHALNYCVNAMLLT